MQEEEAPIQQPISDTLDLHTFKPSEAKDLVQEFLKECKKQGISNARIVHGKGVGILQRTVQSVLREIKDVQSFHLAGRNEGSWGATIVYLKNKGTK